MNWWWFTKLVFRSVGWLILLVALVWTLGDIDAVESLLAIVVVFVPIAVFFWWMQRRGWL